MKKQYTTPDYEEATRRLNRLYSRLRKESAATHSFKEEHQNIIFDQAHDLFKRIDGLSTAIASSNLPLKDEAENKAAHTAMDKIDHALQQITNSWEINNHTFTVSMISSAVRTLQTGIEEMLALSGFKNPEHQPYANSLKKVSEELKGIEKGLARVQTQPSEDHQKREKKRRENHASPQRPCTEIVTCLRKQLHDYFKSSNEKTLLTISEITRRISKQKLWSDKTVLQNCENFLDESKLWQREVLRGAKWRAAFMKVLEDLNQEPAQIKAFGETFDQLVNELAKTRNQSVASVA